ncbi:MAG: pentapeptide repeat-containing protein [Armatimonadetes bacterium]|nr:pentapeptide repeat-containing protein [Armatimonadota bacterium]MDE2206709.1 pentapeptide repeat-containing protein [Armatimonadota bacterium]
MNEIQFEIWNRLVSGESLDGLNPARIDGRIDMRTIRVAEPIVTRTLQTPIGEARVLSGLTIIRNGSWRELDFTGATLPGLRLYYTTVRDCKFDECQLDRLRMWATDFRNVSFQRADLRGAVMGAAVDGRGDTYHAVDFTGADLRNTIHGDSAFVNCLFSDTRLTRVHFRGSNFTDCVFDGELREVIFSRDGLYPGKYPPNEMINVDLRKAQLRWCEFRSLDMDRVLYPEDDEHVVIDEYSGTLERLIAHLESDGGAAAGGLAAAYKNKLRWSGRHQRYGVLNRRDAADCVGVDSAGQLIDLLDGWGVLRATQEVNAMDPKDRLLP